MNPLEITSDSLHPSSVGEQKATLRILLPTGDLFDRELTRVETQLGKNPRNDLVIADSSVSTTHAVIRNDRCLTRCATWAAATAPMSMESV